MLRPVVLLALATTVMGAGAMFTLYTYLATVLAELTGGNDTFVTIALVLIGVGFTSRRWDPRRSWICLVWLGRTRTALCASEG